MVYNLTGSGERIIGDTREKFKAGEIWLIVPGMPHQWIFNPDDTDSEGNQLTLMDIMDDGSDLPEMVDTLIQSQQLYQYLQNCLTPREAEILVQRYGLYGKAPMTQREISKKMGISRSYVSRIEKHAIEKLRLAYQRE